MESSVNSLFAQRFGQRALLGYLLVATAGATLLCLCIRGTLSLYIVSGIFGIVGVMVTLGTLSIAEEACPKRAEGWTCSSTSRFGIASSVVTRGWVMSAPPSSSDGR